MADDPKNNPPAFDKLKTKKIKSTKTLPPSSLTKIKPARAKTRND